jgi:hypothetical protein
MSFLAYMLRGLWSKKVRAAGLTMAVAFAVMTVVSLQVTSSGLEQSAAAVISIGKADLTVAQKGVSDILSSSIDETELARIRAVPGVSSAVGVLVETEKVSASVPLFIEIGIAPQDLAPFGVTVVVFAAYLTGASVGISSNELGVAGRVAVEDAYQLSLNVAELDRVLFRSRAGYFASSGAGR